MIKLIAGESEDGSRLDRLLRKRLPLLGLSGIYGLIRKGSVRVNGKKIKQDHRLKEGDELFIDVDAAEFEPKEKLQNTLADLVNTDFFKRNFHILHEDADIIVCDKPAGLVVHSGSGHDHHDNLIDLATAYIMSSMSNKNSRDKKLSDKNLSDKKSSDKFSSDTSSSTTEPPVLMHRLDRDTSGVIMLAKNTGIVRKLHADMRDGKFTKQYIAVCHNRPPEFEGTVTFAMRRDSGRSGMKMSITTDGGMLSSTTYKIIEYQNDLSKLELLLHTGKTHQLRVHMSHVGAPIVGDVRYGNARLDDKFFASKKIPRRLYLHAHKLTFPHPRTRKPMTVTAKLPKDFSQLFA